MRAGAALLLGSFLAACAIPLDPRVPPAPPETPPAARATPPAPPPAETTPRQRLEREPWLARFWEELTPLQRRRLRERAGRLDSVLGRQEAELARYWDALGLGERVRLLYGPGRPAPRSVPPPPPAPPSAGEAQEV